MKLYVFMGSPRAFKVMALANHLGLDYEVRPLNPMQGEHMKAEFAAINPNRKIPVMDDDGFVLWESNAILQYLAAKKPESGMLPTDARGRAEVTRWQFWDVSSWDPACATLSYERVVKKLLGRGDADPVKLAEGEENFNRYATLLNDHLKGRKYVAADHLTIADISIGAWLNSAERSQYPVAPYPEIKRWHASLSELPAWKKALVPIP